MQNARGKQGAKRIRKRILIIDGHPDPAPERFLRSLANAYVDNAKAAGHEVRVLQLATAGIPLLADNADYLHGSPSRAVQAAQEDIRWCNHLVLFFPLWLGDMPALVKAFFEQVLRPGFAYDASSQRGLPQQLLKGRSARVVVTMGMPAFFYRWYYRAHSVRSLERNILKFVGVTPVRVTFVGGVEMSDARRKRVLERIGAMGGQAG